MHIITQNQYLTVLLPP